MFFSTFTGVSLIGFIISLCKIKIKFILVLLNNLIYEYVPICLRRSKESDIVKSNKEQKHIGNKLNRRNPNHVKSNSSPSRVYAIVQLPTIAIQGLFIEIFYFTSL